MWKLGVDVGGTFTDLCLLNADTGEVWIEKLPSTPGDQATAFIEGVTRVARAASLALADIDFLVHGTTVATNSLLEHKGAKTALLTTQGFRDALEIGTQQRPELYSLTQQKPPALVSRALRKDVPERVASDGTIVEPLDEEAARTLLEEVRSEGIESLAICLLFSFMNDIHEKRLAALAQEMLPGVMVSTSSTISPEYREYWRMSTTAVNAYVMPPVFSYIDRLERQLEGKGVKAGLHVMQSSGGLMTAATTKERPVNTILSGPVGGVVGATFFGGAAGYGNLVTLDMGGTSCDVATILGAEAGRTMMKELGGYPLRTAMVDIETIGAGGGSIACVDAAGGLKVGPASAAAVPGPACYQRGGTEATVSDANVVAGILAESTVLGGGLSLSASAAREAVETHVAQPLGISVEEAAAGIIEIANSNMLGAIRVITVEKGLDPRDFALLAFGGAGPMHACGVAREARIPTVIIPPHPGITSAVGLLMTDIRHPMVAPYIIATAGVDLDRVEEIFRELTSEADRKLRLDGIAPENISFERFADMRYCGQAYEITVPCPEVMNRADGALERLVARFHELHERVYGHHATDEPTQFVTLRVEGVGRVPRGIWRERVPQSRAGDEHRGVYVKGMGTVEAEVLQRGALVAGRQYAGPLVIEQVDTTIWIPPGDVAQCDEHGNLVVKVAVSSAAAHKSTGTDDAITREVVANSLISVAKEMSKALRRSAYSAIIYDMLDYSCALFGPRGELISQDENLPAQLGVMSSAIVWMLRKFEPETISPGDVFIMNHPYLGATHTLDLIIVSPIFIDGRLMAFAGTNAHHMDVGGKAPATEAADNTEIYQEGLILPILRLYEAGRPNQAVLDIMEANVRIPKETLGDVRAQIAACRTGERRWADLCERYGPDEVEAHVEALWSYTEQRVRQEIAGMKPGVYEAESLMDPDFYGTKPIRLRVKIEVRPDSFHADFAGSEPHVKGSLNCPLASTVAAVWYAIRCFIDPTVPQNEGFYRAITTAVPAGSILNPLPPSAVSVRHLTAQKVADLVLQALRQAKPERAAAGTSVAFPTFNLGGVDHRSGESYVCADIVGGGMGAHALGDGVSGVDTHMGNCAMMSAEAMEVEFPVRILKTALVPDSGGAGRYRGGLAVERRYQLLAPTALMGGHYADQTLEETRPWGLDGGGKGRPAAVVFNPGKADERRMRGKEVGYELEEGDVWLLRGSGGGGYGPPEERDPALLAGDLTNGYVTPEAAAKEYHVTGEVSP